MKIQIFDPAMCCSSGVCGPSVDPELVRMQEALRQISKQAPAVEIERFSLSNDPLAYIENAAVGELLRSESPDCLPLTFVDGQLLAKGKYPGNVELQQKCQAADQPVELAVDAPARSCCCGPKC
jgi:hypothetical protein